MKSKGYKVAPTSKQLKTNNKLGADLKKFINKINNLASVMSEIYYKFRTNAPNLNLKKCNEIKHLKDAFNARMRQCKVENQC